MFSCVLWLGLLPFAVASLSSPLGALVRGGESTRFLRHRSGVVGSRLRPRPRLRPGCMSCQLFVPGCFVEMMAGVDGPTRGTRARGSASSCSIKIPFRLFGRRRPAITCCPPLRAPAEREGVMYVKHFKALQCISPQCISPGPQFITTIMAFRPRPPSYSDTNLEEKDSTIVNPRGEPSPSMAWSYGQPMIEIVQLLEAGRGRVSVGSFQIPL